MMFLCLKYVLFQTGNRTQHYQCYVLFPVLRFIIVTIARHVPSGQDLGGPFWFCPCIPTVVPEGPGGGILGPIMPKVTHFVQIFNVTISCLLLRVLGTLIANDSLSLQLTMCSTVA